MKKIPLLFLCLWMVMMSCKKEAPGPAASPEAGAENKLSYLALGDSYTIGEGVAPADRYPVQLKRELEKAGLEVADPTIIARTGWTTGDLKRAIASANIQGKEYDLVSLLIGVNNQFQGRSIQEYKREFTELLLMSIDLAGDNKENVFVLSIPDWGYTPFGKSRQPAVSAAIDNFNAVNKQVTDSLGVAYFNITPISRKGLQDPSLVASDGLHPSAKMYGQWVDLIADDVLQLIKKP